MPEKVRFVSRGEPVREVSFTNSLTGDSEVAKFKDGELETSDPGWIGPLQFLAAMDGHPFREAPPSAAKSKGR